jgi:hypothetical protein
MLKSLRLPIFGTAIAVLTVTAGLWAQSRFYYFNGVGYTFPSSQGSAGNVLTNDGAGNLSWANVQTPQAIFSGAVVMSSVSCPSGWTRLAAADNRVLRGATVAGGTGGSDTHGHSLTGSTGAQAVTITGSTGSTGVSISGSTGTTSISHSHGDSESTANVTGGGMIIAVTGVSVTAADPSHSHGAGTLSGGSHGHGVGTLGGASHTHGVGTLAADSASNLPAYYGIILCQRN